MFQFSVIEDIHTYVIGVYSECFCLFSSRIYLCMVRCEAVFSTYICIYISIITLFFCNCYDQYLIES